MYNLTEAAGSSSENLNLNANVVFINQQALGEGQPHAYQHISRTFTQISMTSDRWGAAPLTCRPFASLTVRSIFAVA